MADSMAGAWVAARDHDDVRAREGGARFAQTSGGKQMATAEGIGRVYEDDIHIARELQMLKAVVQDEPIHAALREFPALCEAICAHAELARDRRGVPGACALRRSWNRQRSLWRPVNYSPADGASLSPR